MITKLQTCGAYTPRTIACTVAVLLAACSAADDTAHRSGGTGGSSTDSRQSEAGSTGGSGGANAGSGGTSPASTGGSAGSTESGGAPGTGGTDVDPADANTADASPGGDPISFDDGGSIGALDAGPGAPGTVLWDGDATQGTKVFKILNTENGSSITVAQDPTYGSIFRMAKPAGSNRGEAHGAKGIDVKEGDILYVGWRSKLTIAQTLTTNAVFQWKAYGANMLQNYPLVIKTLSGQLTLRQFNPGHVETDVWSVPTDPGKWHRFVVGVKASRDINAGYVEFWYDGQPQTLSGGSTRFTCRTLDADYCDPKWGVYGASGDDVTNEISDLRIASTPEAAQPPP